MGTPAEYDPRYRAGIDHFNRGDYFEAHEVWEELWLDCPAEERLFYQGLIQAAVALYHWDRGNARGTRRLFRTGRAKMIPYGPKHLGLRIDEFWRQMETALEEVLHGDLEPEGGRRDPAKSPRIALTSEPEE